MAVDVVVGEVEAYTRRELVEGEVSLEAVIDGHVDEVRVLAGLQKYKSHQFKLNGEDDDV